LNFGSAAASAAVVAVSRRHTEGHQSARRAEESCFT